jgi:steroid 5-alpha reductase family enzyme
MSYYLVTLIALFIYMNLWFIVALIKKRNDVADIAWGLGFVLLAWLAFFLGAQESVGLLVALLVTLWGGRLAFHIYKRNHQKPEDYRYQKWRQEWGVWVYARSYFQIFILQGALLYIIALPILLINQGYQYELSHVMILGMFVWMIGFVFEVVGDKQLAQFVSDARNKGKILQTGLWRYTRHPNYFGEVAQWWGIWIIALGAPMGVYAIISPLLITFLILKVSGVPLLEEKLKRNPEFAQYAARTSTFIPWFVKNNS